MSWKRYTLVLPLCLILEVQVYAQPLRVATVNAWSGLSYEGTMWISSHETERSNADRLDALISGLRDAAPDVIALQEVNPVGSRAQTIADALGYMVISQRVMAGVKVGPVGIPWNLNEGLAILARPELQLEFIDILPLSPDFGAFGNVLSFHFSEQNAALFASIRTEGGERIIIVNTHLPSYPDDSPRSRERLMQICRDRSLSEFETVEWLAILSEQDRNRTDTIEKLLDHIEQNFSDSPVVLLGDFNLDQTSSGIHSILSVSGYVSASSGQTDPITTWDGMSNTLTRFSSDPVHATMLPGPIDQLSAERDGENRTLDYIFIRTSLDSPRILDVHRILDTPTDGKFVSDHYGLIATIEFPDIPTQSQREISSSEYLPMVSYDTDVGFGYGLKSFFLDQFGYQESFDLILFNSTKGEQWYRLVFSAPDFELRQGTIYPLAIDVTLDYDKYLKNVFFGIGPDSKFGDKEEYTREPFEAQVLLTRGLTRRTLVQGGIRYRWIRNSNLSDSSAIPLSGIALSSGTATALSIQTSIRHDTRDSYINPSRGFVLQADAEYAPSIGTTSFYQAGASLQYYTTLMYPKTVFAFRLAGQTLHGTDIPLQFLLSLGGNKTLRGYPQDRFVGRTTLVSNIELRFPLVWRFGAILGWDSGNIWMSPKDVTLTAWRSNTAVGIRFYMDTFIVRADLGFSSETSGFYLNFGHLF